MDYPNLFTQIHRRPGMFGLDGSYGQYCAFINGLDAGNDWRLLTGFREWLVTRLEKGDNLGWPGLVPHLLEEAAHWQNSDTPRPHENREILRQAFRIARGVLCRARPVAFASPHLRPVPHVAQGPILVPPAAVNVAPIPLGATRRWQRRAP